MENKIFPECKMFLSHGTNVERSGIFRKVRLSALFSLLQKLFSSDSVKRTVFKAI